MQNVQIEEGSSIDYACQVINIQTSSTQDVAYKEGNKPVWNKSKRRRLLELVWSISKRFRPPMEIARRFSGKLEWNSLELNKSEILHSVSFKTSHYVDMGGFEMLTGDVSYRIKFTVTRGQGVLGKLLAKGKTFIPRSDILGPTKVVSFPSKKRIIPNEWHSIHVLVDIDKFNKSLVTTGGSGGRSIVETDSGVTVSYGEAFETCSRTCVDSGQIGGIVFWTIDPEEAKFLAARQPSKNMFRTSRRESGTMTTSSPIDMGVEADVPTSWGKEIREKIPQASEYVQAIHLLTGASLPLVPPPAEIPTPLAAKLEPSEQNSSRSLRSTNFIRPPFYPKMSK